MHSTQYCPLIDNRSRYESDGVKKRTMDQLVMSLISTIIDIYILLLFVRLFVRGNERYDALFGMVYKATDPVVSPLGTAVRVGRTNLAPALVIIVLLLLKGMLWGSIPRTLQSFANTLFQLYVLIIIIISGFREFYINPIANFGQRIVNPVRAVAANFSRQIVTVNLLSVLLLVIAHTIVTLVLNAMLGGVGPLPVKAALLFSLSLIVSLTWFFTYVIIINALLSWVSPDPLNPVVQLITLISAPIIDPVRRYIPPIGGMVDISPIIAILALQVANAIGHGFLAIL
jgi:YggT family protein